MRRSFQLNSQTKMFMTNVHKWSQSLDIPQSGSTVPLNSWENKTKTQSDASHHSNIYEPTLQSSDPLKI